MKHFFFEYWFNGVKHTFIYKIPYGLTFEQLTKIFNERINEVIESVTI